MMTNIHTVDLRPYLPEKYNSFRPGQREAITSVLDLIDAGQKVVELNVPTAGGKTLQIFVLLRYLSEKFGWNCIYTSPMVDLVNRQLRNDYPDLPVLVGRSNYRCLVDPTQTAESCPFSMNESGLVQCETCSYRLDWDIFMHSPIGAATFDRYNYDPNLRFRFNALLVDESATLEDKLLNTIDLKLPQEVDVDDLVTSLTIYYHKVSVQSAQLEQEITELKSEARESGNVRPAMKNIGEKKKLYNKVSREASKCAKILAFIAQQVPYIIDQDRHFRLIEGKVLFKELIEKLDFVLLASGTPTTGTLTDDYKVVSSPHPIPVEQRLIHYQPVGRMSFNEREHWSPFIALKIAQLHDKHHKHTLVHCGTYKVAELIYNGFEKHYREKNITATTLNNVILQRDGQDREPSLKRWQAMSDTILLSVERTEGIDLYGPEYPLNIIANVLMMPVKDPWIASRNAFDHKRWYNTTIANKVMQACGRTTRREDDYSETYILDEKFEGFFRQNRMLFHQWFREALRR